MPFVVWPSLEGATTVENEDRGINCSFSGSSPFEMTTKRCNFYLVKDNYIQTGTDINKNNKEL